MTSKCPGQANAIHAMQIGVIQKKFDARVECRLCQLYLSDIILHDRIRVFPS